MEVKIYSIKEVAELFGVSEATISREIERGKLECFKVGNLSKFTMYHLEQYANVKELGKTKREMELEEEKEELRKIIRDRERTISNIKNLLLKETGYHEENKVI